jgi:TfoX/Sxy family transcriptional regulator of competence genes
MGLGLAALSIEAITFCSMAFDEQLAQRIRDVIGDADDVTEKKMFGGLAFLVGGKMAVSASGRGGIMVRADPADAARLVKSGASLVVMRGRKMPGWLRVDAESVRTKAQLSRWVTLGSSYARSLPPK